MTLDSLNQFQPNGSLMPFFVPALIMFIITVMIVTLLFLPATFERKSKIINFYWVGFWMFLGLIFCVAGSEQTLRLLGVNAAPISDQLLTAVTLCFVIFIMFAWARLSSLALAKAAKAIKIKKD